jgi:hypothetical protein
MFYLLIRMRIAMMRNSKRIKSSSQIAATATAAENS